MTDKEAENATIVELLKNIQKDQSDIKTRLEKLELNVTTDEEFSGFGRGIFGASRNQDGGAHSRQPQDLRRGDPRPIGNTGSFHASEEVQAAYDSIHHRLQQKKLHAALVLNQSDKTGFKREDQPTRAIIGKAAQYNETLLKLVIDLEDGQCSEEVLNEIATISVALQYYLKSEYAGLLVKGQFGLATGRMFRQLQRHSTAFSEENIEQVRTAVTLTQNSFGFGGASQPTRSRGRGFRQSFSSRGGYNNNRPNQNYESDFYGSYINRQVPRGRGRGMYNSGSTQFYQQPSTNVQSSASNSPVGS
jgi:hypothetical protein